MKSTFNFCAKIIKLIDTSSLIWIFSSSLKKLSNTGKIFFLINSLSKKEDKCVNSFIHIVFLKMKIFFLSIISALISLVFLSHNNNILLNNSSLYLLFTNMTQICINRSNNKLSYSFFSSSLIITFFLFSFFSGFILFRYNSSIIFNIFVFIIIIPSSPICSRKTKKSFNIFKK